MRPHGDAHAFERFLPIAFRAARHGSGHQIFPRKVIGVERCGGISGLIDLIDRHPLLLAELLIEIAPIGREVRAIAVARRHAEIAHFQNVAGLGVFDIDRAGHDMDAGIAVRLRHLAEDRLYAGIEHQVRIVAGMMGHCLGLDQVAALDGQNRRDRGVEISPMDGFRRRGKLMQGGRDRLFTCIGVIVAKRHKPAHLVGITGNLFATLVSHARHFLPESALRFVR